MNSVNGYDLLWKMWAVSECIGLVYSSVPMSGMEKNKHPMRFRDPQALTAERFSHPTHHRKGGPAFGCHLPRKEGTHALMGKAHVRHEVLAAL